MSYLPTLLLLLLAGAMPALAQPGRLELRGDVGTAAFLDDSRDDHLLLAASLRAYFTQRLSFQPEYQFLNGRGHHDSIFLANVAYDLRPSTRRVVPYLIVGGGLLHFRQSRFSTTEGFLSGGVGAKIYLSPRWYVAPDFRIGVEPHVRLSIGLGYVLRP
jgi:hypothetical protein